MEEEETRRVENRVFKRYLSHVTVDASCENNELRTEHTQRTGECNGRHLLEAFLFKFHWCEDIRVVCGFAEVTGAASKKDGAIGFGEPQEGRPSHSCEDEADPERPAPAKDGRYEASNWWSNQRADTGSLEKVLAL
jgi:hypothetical protein